MILKLGMVSGERLQDHWSTGYFLGDDLNISFCLLSDPIITYM